MNYSQLIESLTDLEIQFDEFMSDAYNTVDMEGWPIPEEVENWLRSKETSEQPSISTVTEQTTFNRGAVINVVSQSGESLATLTVHSPVTYVQVDSLK